MIYLFEAGDTLESVAIKFNTTPRNIAVKNNLSSYPEKGDLLSLCKESGKLYKVNINDTIQSICKRENISINDFTQKNNINYVYINQIVIIW